MKELSYHELLNRGTPDFQIELYRVTKAHPRYNMQHHWHNKHEIVHVSEGSISLRLNEKVLTLTEGESVFIPAGVVHGGTPKDCTYMCIVFSPSILHASQKNRIIMKTRFTTPVALKNDTVTKSIVDDLTDKMPGYEFAVTGKLYLLIYNLLRSGDDQTTPPNAAFERIKPALTYIEENYFKEISLGDMASRCSMSPNYFCRYFKSITQETPVGYITRYRIEMACEFLLSGMTITDTAYACGFNDASYFINVFKRHTGHTPQKYKSVTL